MSRITKAGLGGLSQAEKIKTLAELYDEDPGEINSLMTKFDLIIKFCRDMGLPEGQTWATVLLSTADALKLDVDTPEGLGAAATIAALMMRSS